MAQHDILGRNAEKDMGIRVRNLSTATPLASTSVTNGHTEFNGNESLLVKGSQKVSGWLIVTGTLKLVGSLLMEGITSMTGTFTAIGTVLLQGVVSITGPNTTVTGPFHVQGVTAITGDTTVTGPFHVSGNQDNTGTLAIKGDTTVEADLNVINSGVVNIGDGLTLEPSPAGGGAINFNPTGSIAAGLGKVTMVAPDLTTIVSVGGYALDVVGGTIKASLGSDTTAGHLANVYYNPTTRTLYFKP